ncbi:14282_t:CDS:2, partial [Funneliformis geosporum]
MSAITPNSEKLEPEEIEVLDPDYFTFNPSWNLLDFLIYRQKCSDFRCNKKDEHARYARNLSIIINNKRTHEVMKAGNALALFQNEKKSQFVIDFWKCVASSNKRKVTAIAEREALVEEHTNNVASSVFQQDQLLRGKYTSRLGDTDFLGDNYNRSEKRQRRVKSTDVDDERGTPERQIYPSELSVEKIYVPSGSTEEKEANYPSNDQYESYTGTHEDEDENPFIVKKREGLRNNKFKTILSWKHVIDSININDISRNDWMADGHNVSLDFRNFQLTSIKQLETDQTFSYVKDMERILSLSSIMYCNEAKPEFVLCSEKEWNKIRPRSLVPIMLPKDVLMIIAEYNT